MLYPTSKILDSLFDNISNLKQLQIDLDEIMDSLKDNKKVLEMVRNLANSLAIITEDVEADAIDIESAFEEVNELANKLVELS